MIPYEPTSSGTSWWTKEVPEMWGLISNINLDPMYQQTAGWQKAIDLASTNLYRLKDFRDKLTTAWPPEKSEASQQYVAKLDGLIASVQDVYDAAVANKTSASNLTAAIGEAQRKVEPLYDQYLANLRTQSSYDSALAAKKNELADKYGINSRGYGAALYSYTTSNPDPGAAAKNAQITEQVRSAMSSLSTDLVVSSGKMVEPKPYQKPVLAQSRDDSSNVGGGGSYGSGGGSAGGGGSSGGVGSVPIIPMPAYVPPPQPTLTGGFTPTPTAPTPAPVAPISTLPQPHPTGPIGMPPTVGPVGPGGVVKPPPGPGPGLKPGPGGQTGIGPIGSGPGGGRPGLGTGPGGRPGIMGPNGVIGGGGPGGPGGRGGAPGGVRGVNPAGGVIGRPGASGTPGVAGAGRSGVTGTGGAAGRGGPGAAGRGGAGQPGMVGAAGRKRGQTDEHGHEWDPDNPWEVAEGVAPVVEAPGETGPIDPGPAIGGRR